jgi:uncharacterized delta-60 repeat protein
MSKTDSNSNSGIRIDLNSDGTVSARFAGSDPHNVVDVLSGTQINDGHWHQVTVTFTSGTNVVLYVDGAQKGTGTLPLGSFTYASGSPLRFGKSLDNFNPIPFVGLLDDVAVFNQALTSTRVASLFTDTEAQLLAEANLVSLYEANGDATDSKSGINGTLNGFFVLPNSVIGVNPLLDQNGPQPNGGPTNTIALLPGGPAIDAGTTSGAPPTDQRGVVRDPDSASNVDIGAYEFAGALTTQFASPFFNGSTGVVNNAAIGTVTGVPGLAYVAVGSSGPPSSSSFAVALYNGAGNLLASTTTSFGGGTTGYATAAVIGSDGNIYVAGNTSVNHTQFGVASYSYNGTTTLHTNWSKTSNFPTPPNGPAAVANGIAFFPGNGSVTAKVAVVGAARGGGSPSADFAVLELNTSDGGGAKQIITDIFGQADAAEAAVFDSSGLLYVAGYAYNITPSLTGNMDFALVRYKADGSGLDTGFNVTGIATQDFGGGGASAKAVAIDPTTGNIVVAGYSVVPTGTPDFSATVFALARYTPTGSLDSNFNGGGTVLGSASDFGNPVGADAVLIHSNSTVDAIGYIFNGVSATPHYQIAVAQYNSTGGLDTTNFNQNNFPPGAGKMEGAFVNSSGTKMSGWAQAALIDPTNSSRFWAAGGAVDSGKNYSLAVAEYDPPPSPASAPATSSANVLSSIAPVGTIPSVPSVGELIRALLSADGAGRSVAAIVASCPVLGSVGNSPLTPDLSPASREGSKGASPILGGLDPLIDATTDGDWTDRDAFFKNQPQGQESADRTQEPEGGTTDGTDRTDQ